MVDILIVRYGVPELEKQCIAAVRKFSTDVECVVHVRDNLVRDSPLAVVWNEMIKASSAEYICLLNNDTLVEDQWLSKLLEVFQLHSDAGIVGPVTNRASGVQGRQKVPGMPKRIFESNMMVGFCMVFPKALWSQVGGFDEGYELYGEDSDFCRLVLQAGKKLYVREDVYVFHHGAQGTPVASKKGKDIAAIRRRSSQRYSEKWLRK